MSLSRRSQGDATNSPQAPIEPRGLDAPWLLDARLAYNKTTWGVTDPPPERDDLSPELVEHSRRYQLRVIPAGQPLLYSRGPHSGGRVWQSYADAAARDAAGSPTDGLYREVIGGVIDGGGPSSRTPPGSRRVATARAADGAGCAFVVLGVSFDPWGLSADTGSLAEPRP